MSRTASDARQIIIRRFLDQLAGKANFDGTADAKPASSTELDNLLDSLNIELKSPLRLDATLPTNDLVITVGPAVVVNTETTRQRSIPHIGTLLPNSFTSGTYTFPAADAGTIVASPGVNNTLNCPSGMYVKVLLYMDTLGLLNTLVGDPNAVEATATVLPAPDSSLPIGYVTLQNIAGVIQNIAQNKIYQFGTGAGGGGSGDASGLDVILRDRFAVTDFEFLEENIFKKDQSTKVDTGASTGSFSFAKSAYLLSSIGQTMVSYNNLDPLFLAEGVDITDVEFYLQWLSGFADGAATYAVSRDGGTNWTTMTMSSIGAGDYRGYLTFADESVQQSLQTYANSNADTSSPLTASGNDQARAQKFTVTNTEVLRSMDIFLNKTQTSGTVAGKYKISIIRDSAGSPSLLSQDNISESDLLNASALSVGLNTVTVTMPQVVMVPGDYWIVFSTDADYKASYSAAVRSIDVRSDSSSPTGGSAYQYDGAVWAASAGPISLVYLLKGRVHDLRVRVTSGTVTKYIEGYGVYYGLQSGVTSASGEKRFQKFYFTGDSNTTDFALNFTPDPELLEILDPYRGQAYAIEEGVARIIGTTVRFEPNTFNFPGESIVLIFRQVKGSTIDNSNANAAAISSIQSNLIDVGNQLSETQRVAVPLLTVPNTTIFNRAQIPDPSQDLKPRLGIDRIMIEQIQQLQNEFGPNGEPVYSVLNDDRGLIRYVGAGWTTISATFGQAPSTATVGDYLEITFYGTGLNLLIPTGGNSSTDYRVSIDGGSEGANLYPASSTILSVRNYAINAPLNVASGLVLGIHTVKIRLNGLNYNLTSYGFEILNENQAVTTGNTHTSTLIDGIPSTAALAIGMTVSGSGVPSGATISSVDSATQVTISAATTTTLTATALTFAGSLKINPGISYNAGKKLTLASAQIQSYKAGFETGTLGTRGGRVLVYQKSDGTVAKAVQPVDAASANLTSANHANEEVIRTYSPREFGAGRADDFSFIGSTSTAAAFTLDDGTATLTSSGARFSGGAIFQNNTNDFFTLTFVGTGLDIGIVTGGSSDTYTISVDGTNITTTQLFNLANVYKIVSGLPYGTHTVKILRNAVVSGATFGYFKIYGPKKPTLPTGAVELADYNIMADFTTRTAGLTKVGNGVLRKFSARELVYSGSGWAVITNPVNFESITIRSSTVSDYAQYTFWGTGFEMSGQSATSANFTVSVDGSSNLSAYTTSFTGGFNSFTAATGVVTATSAVDGSSIRVSGLPLGLHTVKFLVNAAFLLDIDCIDIITPIHSPKSNQYADLQNTLPVGSCGISDNRPTKTIKELTTLPSKAWAQATAVANGPTATSGGVLVPVPDMSLTIKTSGGPLKVSYSIASSMATTGNTTVFQVFVNGVAVGPQSAVSQATAGYIYMATGSVIVPVAAGVHKVDLYWSTTGGATSMANGVNRNLVAEEK